MVINKYFAEVVKLSLHFVHDSLHIYICYKTKYPLDYIPLQRKIPCIGGLRWGFALGVCVGGLHWGFTLGVCVGDLRWGFALGVLREFCVGYTPM